MTLRVILDTDIETDCDDVGAVLTLHALAQSGKLQIAGMIASTRDLDSALYLKALLLELGSPEIPVGGNMHLPHGQNYLAHVERCQKILYTKARDFKYLQPEIADGLRLYRRLLAASPDGGVRICAIGLFTLLAALLESPADDISPLTGRELLAQKVEAIYSMALAAYPAGCDRFNYAMDKAAAAKVLNEVPCKIVISALGSDVLTGAELMQTASGESVAALAYRVFGGRDPAFRRPSWDQMTVLAASSEYPLVLREVCGGNIIFDAATGENRFTGDLCGNRYFMVGHESAAYFARLIEDLMLKAVRRAN